VSDPHSLDLSVHLNSSYYVQGEEKVILVKGCESLIPLPSFGTLFTRIIMRGMKRDYNAAGVSLGKSSCEDEARSLGP
jgi:hypothetical protein